MMAAVPLEHGLILAAASCSLIGLAGPAGAPQHHLHADVDRDHAQRRGLAFVVAGARWGQPDGQVMFIFILAVAAAEVAVGLALVLADLYSHVPHAGHRRRSAGCEARRWVPALADSRAAARRLRHAGARRSAPGRGRR